MNGWKSVTLKVCEGCGTLWVRRRVLGVYCGPCEWLLQGFPDPQTRLLPGRPKKVRAAEPAEALLGGAR